MTLVTLETVYREPWRALDNLKLTNFESSYCDYIDRGHPCPAHMRRYCSSSKVGLRHLDSHPGHNCVQGIKVSQADPFLYTSSYVL